MNNTGRIVAQDIDPDRMKLIRENCRRLGVTMVQTALPGVQNPLAPLPPTFDRILVDAPCSNTGVLRRRVDLRWRLQPAELDRLRDTQSTLLQQAADRLRPGGTLVYSTCSLEPEENTEVVRGFLDKNEAFSIKNERQIMPCNDNFDGAYVAVLQSRS